MISMVWHRIRLLSVALIAVARKVIILDLEKYGSLTLVGIAAMILALAVACYAVKRHLKKIAQPAAHDAD